MVYSVYSDELYHHGIKGQKWGVRRWQNPDGSLTEAGKKHYGLSKLDASDRSKLEGKSQQQIQKMANREAVKYSGRRTVFNTSNDKAAKAFVEQYLNDKYGSEVAANAIKKSESARAGRIALTALSTAVFAYNVADVVAYQKTGSSLSDRAVTSALNRHNNPSFKSNGNKFQYNSSDNSFTGTFRDLGVVKENTGLMPIRRR